MPKGSTFCLAPNKSTAILELQMDANAISIPLNIRVDHWLFSLVTGMKLFPLNSSEASTLFPSLPSL